LQLIYLLVLVVFQGIEQAGFDVLVAVENIQSAATYAFNFP